LFGLLHQQQQNYFLGNMADLRHANIAHRTLTSFGHQTKKALFNEAKQFTKKQGPNGAGRESRFGVGRVNRQNQEHGQDDGKRTRN